MFLVIVSVFDNIRHSVYIFNIFICLIIVFEFGEIFYSLLVVSFSIKAVFLDFIYCLSVSYPLHAKSLCLNFESVSALCKRF